jgi:hypothetical protein
MAVFLVVFEASSGLDALGTGGGTELRENMTWSLILIPTDRHRDGGPGLMRGDITSHNGKWHGP